MGQQSNIHLMLCVFCSCYIGFIFKIVVYSMFPFIGILAYTIH